MNEPIFLILPQFVIIKGKVGKNIEDGRVGPANPRSNLVYLGG